MYYSQLGEVDDQYMTVAEKASLSKYKQSLTVLSQVCVCYLLPFSKNNLVQDPMYLVICSYVVLFQFEASVLANVSVFDQYFGYHYPR